MFSLRSRLVALVAAAVLLLSACDVDITVQVDVESDGSGLVTMDVRLDQDAAARIPDLEQQLDVDDLIDAGWEITGPLPSAADSVQITASKPFNDPDQLQDVLDDLTGPDGIFQDFRLERTTDFAQIDFDLSGTVDMSRGVNLFSDSGLIEALEGRPLGIDLDALEAEIGPLEEAVRVTFRTALPGEAEDDSGAEVEIFTSLGDAPVPVSLSTTQEDSLAQILRLVGYAAAALAAVSFVVNLLIWGVERRRKKAAPEITTPEPVRGNRPASAVMTPTKMSDRRSQGLSIVVVDGYGVLYMPMLPTLVSFAADRGSTVDRNELVEILRRACDGAITTTELWEELGVEGDSAQLDVEFLGLVQLRPGAKDFVKELRRRGMHVSGIANGVTTWTDALRARDGLDDVAPWITSSEAGVRTPNPGLFEALRRASGVPFENWLLIHGDLESLETAKTLGVSTVWFTQELPPANNRPAHALVSGFADFFRRR